MRRSEITSTPAHYREQPRHVLRGEMPGRLTDVKTSSASTGTFLDRRLDTVAVSRIKEDVRFRWVHGWDLIGGSRGPHRTPGRMIRHEAISTGNRQQARKERAGDT